jgi:hypothetical protein
MNNAHPCKHVPATPGTHCAPTCKQKQTVTPAACLLIGSDGCAACMQHALCHPSASWRCPPHTPSLLTPKLLLICVLHPLPSVTPTGMAPPGPPAAPPPASRLSISALCCVCMQPHTLHAARHAGYNLPSKQAMLHVQALSMPCTCSRCSASGCSLATKVGSDTTIHRTSGSARLGCTGR